VPAFDHEVHDPEEDAITILPSHKVILVEGNYLLLPEVGAVQAWFRDP
jgi:pantothenate kinase